MADVGLETGLCTWALATMLAIVLRWFIWFIAMATEAGGSPTGSRGWGIIMKGRSSPMQRRKNHGITT